MILKSLRNFSVALIAVLSFSVLATAQTAPDPQKFAHIKIGNFGQMDERLFRGAQPEPGDYAALKELGINTVIDLRNDPTDYEKKEVEALGMKYVNIPMSGWKYAKDSQVEGFMQVMSDPSTVAFVHCKAGKHRTGLTGAVYRFEKYGWDYDKAYKEMKNYDYTSWPVHHSIKQFVMDYAKQMKHRPAPMIEAVAAPAAQGTN